MVVSSVEGLLQGRTRRDFLRLLGAGGTAVLLPGVFACSDDDNDNGNNQNCGSITDPCTNGGVSLDLSTDIGIFNYAYALEQLEAAFYSAVVSASTFSSTFTAEEQEILTDIRNHEVIHRDFLKFALGNARIADLAVNNTTVATALASKNSILTTAKAFEDLGVAAYNGAGKQLKNASNLLVAGKIVSVEARHAAVIRDLLDTAGTAFADSTVVNANGLDVKAEPDEVLTRVKVTNFVTTQISIGTGGSVARSDSQLPPA